MGNEVLLRVDVNEECNPLEPNCFSHVDSNLAARKP